MGEEYGEYCTVSQVRGTDLGTTQTTDDTALLDYIRQVSSEIDDIAGRRFYPRIETRQYDTPTGYELDFSDDLLEVTTLTNGDSTTIASDSYNLYPLNAPVKRYLKIIPSEDTFAVGPTGYPDAAITLMGVFGYQRNNRAGWRNLTTMSGTTMTPTDTSMVVPTGKVKAGQLLKVNAEYVYAQSVASSTSTDAVTCVRAVNGSTAAAHTTGETISNWTPGPDIETLARNATVAYYRLRSNPTGNSIIVDGVEYATPKDVSKYISTKLAELGCKRLGFA